MYQPLIEYLSEKYAQVTAIMKAKMYGGADRPWALSAVYPMSLMIAVMKTGNLAVSIVNDPAPARVRVVVDSRVESCTAKEVNETDPPGPGLLESLKHMLQLEAVFLNNRSPLNPLESDLLLSLVEETALVGAIGNKEED